jgi:DNA-binding NarL/FixJ family response regulator
MTATRRRPVKVLFVEDNPGDARLVKEALAESRTAEFELTHVQHLHEGLRRLARHKFDVVLLDLLLDDTPRLGALLEIYEQSSRVPVVVLTGLEDASVRDWARKEGAREYLIKGKVESDVLADALLDAAEQAAFKRTGASTQRRH